MTMLIGTIALTVALLASAAGLMSAAGAAVLNSRSGLRVARWSIVAVLGAFTVASIALLHALIQSDFRLSYVATFTERALPLGYKYAAFWAGQEGSLLLWGWLVAVFGVAWIVVTSRSQERQTAIAIGVIAVVCALFASIMLFCDSPQRGDNANPFHEAEVILSDGQGLNPMLQDPAMIAHPPLLFAGYAGFTIPFAVMIGALLARRKDNDWLGSIRRWMVVSWLFLTVGILLGAQWAYMELGWGGYWAWDPVENASLLPWLTGTALLHSIMPQQQRGMLKRWNAALIAVTFLLCIFGTWITRSGVVQSVHSFGESPIGTFFLVFMILATVFCAVLILLSDKCLRSEHPLETIWGREGMFLIANVLLVLMTVTTAVGTLFPAISQMFGFEKTELKAPFYNNVVVPLGLVLMAMMAIGPLLSLGKEAGNQLARRLGIPLIGGAVVAVVTGIVLKPHTSFESLWTMLPLIWSLACAFIIGVSVVSLVADLLAAVVRRVQGEKEFALTALVRVIDGNHRRYGGQTVHIGMLMLMVGIAGSSLYNSEHDLEMVPGEKVELAGLNVRFDEVINYRGENYRGRKVTLTVTDKAGITRTVTPEMRWYDKFQRRNEEGRVQEQINREVGIWTTARQDAYVTLHEVFSMSDGQKVVKPVVAALRLRINPLVMWLWIGGIVMIAGCVLAVLPRLLPAGAVVDAEVMETPAAGKGSKPLAPIRL